MDRRGRSPYGTRSLQSIGFNRGSTANRVSSRSISPSGRTRSRESRRDFGRPNMQPDRYDGSTPRSEYQAHFKFCAEINGWTDDGCSLYLAAKLKGQAQKVLGDRRCRRGYRELVNLLSRSFGPGQHSEMYLAELRKTDESIQKMGLEIRRLAELANPEMDDDARDRLSRMHFRDALENHEIRAALFQARPSTLEEAIEVATELDSYFEVEKTRPSKLRPQARVMISQDVEVAKLKEKLARLQTRLNEEGKARRPRDLSEMVCYGCSQTGHYRLDCPQNNKFRKRGSVCSTDRGQMLRDDGGFGHEQSETAKQGLFVQGFIQDQPVEFLIDTGASETFISLEKYRQLSRAGLPILMEDTMGVNLANGEPIPVAGKMQLNVQLGEAQACVPVTVGGIAVPAILGMDVLLKTGSKLNLSRLQFLCEGRTLPL